MKFTVPCWFDMCELLSTNKGTHEKLLYEGFCCIAMVPMRVPVESYTSPFCPHTPRHLSCDSYTQKFIERFKDEISTALGDLLNIFT